MTLRAPVPAVLLLCLAAFGAHASVPRLVPDRDVTVDYTVEPRDGPRQAVRVSIEAGGRHLRITAQDLPTAFLVDRSTGIATILLPLLKMYSTADVARYDPEVTVLRGAQFERHGEQTVAGLRCTLWTARAQGGTAEGCITPGGVILKGSATNRHGRLGSVVASVVTFDRLEPAFFLLPGDYRFAGELPPSLLGIRP